MNISNTNYGSRVLSLHKLLRGICQDLQCDFSYSPMYVPTYDRQEPHLFGRFPWYYALVSRGRSIYIHKKQNFFTGLSLPWGDVRDNFSNNSIVLLRPEIYGETDNIVTFVRQVSEKTGCSIIVKHIQEGSATRLIESGFRYYHDNEGWNSSAQEDDQTFPEVIVDLQETLSKPPTLQRSLSKAKKWQKEFSVECVEPMKLERTEVRNKYKQEILTVFYKWLEHFHKRQPWAVDEDFLNWHLSAFETLVADDRLILVYLRDPFDEPIGVFSLAKTSAFQLDVVFSFIANDEGDFQRLAYREIFERMFQMGFKYMNLGGSEVESLFNFKNSLAASTLIQGRHVIFNGGDG